MRWIATLAWLALLAPIALAQAPSADAPVSFLVYHASGGRDPDPFASAQASPPSHGERLPATLFDRAAQADRAPENAPESALAHFREMQARLTARERTPSVVELRVEGELVGDLLRVRASSNASLPLEIVLFEHAAPLAGRPQPYVARARIDPPDGNASAEVPLDPSWRRERLGVVVLATTSEGVAQSATWMAGAPPVVQREKSVLVEHVTASWCDPCAPADDAIALLSTQRGAAGSLPSGETRYFREPTWLLYTGLAIGALAAISLVRRRGT